MKLLPVLQGIFRRIPQKRDHRDKKLRTNDIHLWILIGHIHNTVVVKLVVDLKKRNKDRILTALFLAVFIQFLKKVLVFVLGGGHVGLVLHLKHDRDKLCAVFAALAVDEVSLAAGSCIIVFFKVSIGECGHSNGVELREAMLFQTFSDHFCGLTRFEIFVIFDLFILQLQLFLILFLQ